MEREILGEAELKQALERRPAPPDLKRRILSARARRHAEARNAGKLQWMRLAASLTIVAILLGAGDGLYRRHEEQRKGEEARRQVMTALRIAGQTLNEVQQKLAAKDREGDSIQ